MVPDFIIQQKEKLRKASGLRAKDSSGFLTQVEESRNKSSINNDKKMIRLHVFENLQS